MPAVLFALLSALFRRVFNAPAARDSPFAPVAGSHVVVVSAPPKTQAGSRPCVGFAVLFSGAFVRALPPDAAHWAVRLNVGDGDTYVGFLCVAETSRRQGVGTALMATLKQRTVAANVGGAIWLESDESNGAAHEWYERSGFDAVGELATHKDGNRTMLMCWRSVVVIHGLVG